MALTKQSETNIKDGVINQGMYADYLLNSPPLLETGDSFRCHFYGASDGVSAYMTLVVDGSTVMSVPVSGTNSVIMDVTFVKHAGGVIIYGYGQNLTSVTPAFAHVKVDNTTTDFSVPVEIKMQGITGTSSSRHCTLTY